MNADDIAVWRPIMRKALALEPLTWAESALLADRNGDRAFLGLLLFTSSATYHATQQLREEVRRMASNDAALGQAIIDLTTAYSTETTAIGTYITTLQNNANAQADPEITDAVNKIEGIVANLNQATTSAQAAVAAIAPPAPAAAADPTPSAPAAAPDTDAPAAAATSSAASPGASTEEPAQ